MKIIIITGQTASGKTGFARRLAQKTNGQVINADSRQIYKFLDIVTGKDKFDGSEILFYDLIDPKEYFSSFDYQQTVIPILKKMLGDQKTPIIVGGTYFYLFHLLYQVKTENSPPDFKLRNMLNQKTTQELQQILIQKNARLFNQLNESDRKNPQRLIRKIEIPSLVSNNYLNTNKYRFYLDKKLGIPDLEIEFIGLRFSDKNDLIKSIKLRVEKRIGQGAINEVKDLLKKGYQKTNPGLKTIGCKQIVDYLEKKISREEMITSWVNKEVQYAKRQYTFMKKDPNIKWQTI